MGEIQHMTTEWKEQKHRSKKRRVQKGLDAVR
jgi:hypothetical protein